jgi:hypothetical protein
LAQAGDLGLRRSRCVVVRRLGVGALRQRWIDAMEFGGFDVPLAMFVLVAADFAGLIAHRSVVLFTPAAAARVRLMAVRLAAVRGCAQRGARMVSARLTSSKPMPSIEEPSELANAK